MNKDCKNSQNPLRLGVYDSGVGGLSVLSALEKQFSSLCVDYLADRKHLPYGEKTKVKIISYSEQNAKFLLQNKIEALIIACHTSCVYAKQTLQAWVNVPIFDLTDALLRSLEKFSSKKTLALLGTPSMINSGVYQKLINDHYPTLKIIPCPCPSFVPLIESGRFTDHTYALKKVREDLFSLLNISLDGIILGCTHYPFLTSYIEQILPNLECIDPAEQLAIEVFIAFSHKQAMSKACVEERFFVTEGKEVFQHIGEILLKRPFKNVQEISL